MPSSASRSSVSSCLGAAEVGVDLVDHRAGAERLRGARQPAQLGEDVLARGDAELERIAGREPELVEALDVPRLGDRDAQRAAVERERDRDDALEHGQRDQLGGLLVDARSSARSTSGDLVPHGEGAGDALGGATPSSTSACASEPWPARPRTIASLSGATRPVAESRSTTSSPSC